MWSWPWSRSIGDVLRLRICIASADAGLGEVPSTSDLINEKCERGTTSCDGGLRTGCNTIALAARWAALGLPALAAAITKRLPDSTNTILITTH